MPPLRWLSAWDQGMTQGPSHVVMYSGGMGSYFAAKRVIARHGAENVVLLFADTSMEDQDLYRFLDDSERTLGARMVRIRDGRTPWDVYFQHRFIGNWRRSKCSTELKRKPCDEWVQEHCTVETTQIYVGIDWSEEHRFERIKERHLPWVYRAPLCEAPYINRGQMLRQMTEDGLDPPRLYSMGFSHNNCGGFCIKAGKAHFANLLRTMPERYAFHEAQEREFQRRFAKQETILVEGRGDKTRRLTLEALRQRLEKTPELPEADKHDWGGCGCFAGI
ncbi:MAG: hypothetical protein EOP64_00055 [Sphingomonas sp.]|nr:MAG: hypothetical protein EOP64_00055 [Sphingomonas sp.]